MELLWVCAAGTASGGVLSRPRDYQRVGQRYGSTGVLHDLPVFRTQQLERLMALGGAGPEHAQQTWRGKILGAVLLDPHPKLYVKEEVIDEHELVLDSLFPPGNGRRLCLFRVLLSFQFDDPAHFPIVAGSQQLSWTRCFLQLLGTQAQVLLVSRGSITLNAFEVAREIQGHCLQDVLQTISASQPVVDVEQCCNAAWFHLHLALLYTRGCVPSMGLQAPWLNKRCQQPSVGTSVGARLFRHLLPRPPSFASSPARGRARFPRAWWAQSIA